MRAAIKYFYRKSQKRKDEPPNGTAEVAAEDAKNGEGGSVEGLMFSGECRTWRPGASYWCWGSINYE
jgi:hypothetical protein